MREGYYNYDKLGNKIVVPDSRKEWVSSVIALRLLLRPEIKRDKGKSFDGNYFDTEEKNLIDKWGYLISGDKKVIPLLDEYFPVEFQVLRRDGSSTGKVKTQMIKGKFNSNFHRYWDEMVQLYDEMYAQLNVLIDQCNYFKQEVAY